MDCQHIFFHGCARLKTDIYWQILVLISLTQMRRFVSLLRAGEVIQGHCNNNSDHQVKLMRHCHVMVMYTLGLHQCELSILKLTKICAYMLLLAEPSHSPNI